MNFTYLKPKTLLEAINLKSELGDTAMFLAGGTDVLLKMKRRAIDPSHIISLNTLEELTKTTVDTYEISIGALTTLRMLEKDSVFSEYLPVLAETAKKMASPQIRALATLGGNLCNASPAADMAPPLIALGAKIELTGQAATRSMMLEDFFTGPGMASLKSDEVMTRIVVPRLPATGRAVYLKESIRRAHDVAMVGVGVMVDYRQDKNIINNAKIVLGAVAPTPIRAVIGEEALKNKPMYNQLFEEVAVLAAEASRPIDDLRTSAAYRKKLVQALVKRALKQLLPGGDQ